MTEPSPVIRIVDDDASFRTAIARTLSCFRLRGEDLLLGGGVSAPAGT